MLETNNNMAVCPTCNSRLSCGCQLKTASDGARVCTLCYTKYEQGLASKKVNTPKTNGPANSPSNVKVTYNPPK